MGLLNREMLTKIFVSGLKQNKKKKIPTSGIVLMKKNFFLIDSLESKTNKKIFV